MSLIPVLANSSVLARFVHPGQALLTSHAIWAALSSMR